MPTAQAPIIELSPKAKRALIKTLQNVRPGNSDDLKKIEKKLRSYPPEALLDWDIIIPEYDRTYLQSWTPIIIRIVAEQTTEDTLITSTGPIPDTLRRIICGDILEYCHQQNDKDKRPINHLTRVYSFEAIIKVLNHHARELEKISEKFIRAVRSFLDAVGMNQDFWSAYKKHAGTILKFCMILAVEGERQYGLLYDGNMPKNQGKVASTQYFFDRARTIIREASTLHSTALLYRLASDPKNYDAIRGAAFTLMSVNPGNRSDPEKLMACMVMPELLKLGHLPTLEMIAQFAPHLLPAEARVEFGKQILESRKHYTRMNLSHEFDFPEEEVDAIFNTVVWRYFLTIPLEQFPTLHTDSPSFVERFAFLMKYNRGDKEVTLDNRFPIVYRRNIQHMLRKGDFIRSLAWMTVLPETSGYPHLKEIRGIIRQFPHEILAACLNSWGFLVISNKRITPTILKFIEIACNHDILTKEEENWLQKTHKYLKGNNRMEDADTLATIMRAKNIPMESTEE